MATLTHLDRCDAPGCGARAYASAEFNPINEQQIEAHLLLCGHHFHEYEALPTFQQQLKNVIDETYRILNEGAEA